MNRASWKDRFDSAQLCRRADRAHRAGRDTAEARRLLEEAARKNPQDVRPLLAQARIELESGNRDAALALIKRAEKKDENHSACQLLRGEVLYWKQDYALAQKAFEQVLKQDRQNVIAKNFLALCHLGQNRVEDFRRELAEEKLWHRPDLVRAVWIQQMLPVWKLHLDSLKARATKGETMELDASASPRARMAFARKALRKGKAEAAYEALQPMADKKQKDQNFVDLFAEASARARRGALARTMLEKRLNAAKPGKEPKDPYFFFLLGQCCFVEGDYPASVKYYEQGEPHTAMPYYLALFQYYEALSWLAAGKLSEAGERIEAACRTDTLLASLIALSLTGLLCRGEPLREPVDEE